MMRPFAATLSVACVLALAESAGTAQEVRRESHTIAIDDFEMYYETMGQGDPLLLLHGWSGTGHDYDPFVEELSRRFQVILPDLRGHGRSTNPGGRYTMARSARDVLALLDSLGLERVRAIGASMGAITLLHVATSEPARVQAMVLAGAGGRFPPRCRESMASRRPEDYPASWWQEMRGKHAFGDGQIRAIAEMLPAFAEDQTDVAFGPEDLAKIQARTLLVHGDRDWCFPVEIAAELYHGIPGAALWVVPFGGHVPITGPNAEPFLAITLAFLGESGPAPS